MNKQVPHEFSDRKIFKYIFCTPNQENRDPFMDRIVTRDEKWILCDSSKILAK